MKPCVPTTRFFIYHFHQILYIYIEFQKILQEVKVLTTLSHPNIIKYYQSWMEFDEKGLIFGEPDFPLENKYQTFSLFIFKNINFFFIN